MKMYVAIKGFVKPELIAVCYSRDSALQKIGASKEKDNSIIPKDYYILKSEAEVV